MWLDNKITMRLLCGRTKKTNEFLKHQRNKLTVSKITDTILQNQKIAMTMSVVHNGNG
jgi:hypothetical protein